MNPEKLKNKRLKANLTQQQVADQLGLSRETLSQYENGKRTPSIATLTRIAEFFNCSIKTFF